MCVPRILFLFCCLNPAVLTTWKLTMDQLKDLTGLDPLELGSHSGHDQCDYLDPDLNVDILEDTDNDLNIVQLNIRGLIGKQGGLCKEIKGQDNVHKVHVYILNETWVTKANEHMIDIPHYQFISKHRPNKKGGGVGLLVHDELQFKTRNDLKLAYDSDLEYQFIELKTRKRNIIVGSMYRPPQSKEKEFLKDYSKLHEIIGQQKDKEIVIGMDHNMDFLKASRHTNTQKFIEYNLEINMLPVITKPTRITDTSATLIDNILISGKLQQAYHSGIIISDMSDHLPTVIKLLNAKQDMKKQQTLTYRKITDENIKLINEELQGYNWEEILKKRGTDDSFNILHETLRMSMDKHMPLKTRKLTKKDINKEPWITKGVENCIKKQKQLYKKSIGKRATIEDHKKYKEYKSMLQKIKRKAKMDHYQDKCLRYKNETRKLWDVINTITGKKRKRDSMIKSLKVGSIFTHDAKEITDTFCNFFCKYRKGIC